MATEIELDTSTVPADFVCKYCLKNQLESKEVWQDYHFGLMLYYRFIEPLEMIVKSKGNNRLEANKTVDEYKNIFPQLNFDLSQLNIRYLSCLESIIKHEQCHFGSIYYEIEDHIKPTTIETKDPMKKIEEESQKIMDEYQKEITKRENIPTVDTKTTNEAKTESINNILRVDITCKNLNVKSFNYKNVDFHYSNCIDDVLPNDKFFNKDMLQNLNKYDHWLVYELELPIDRDTSKYQIICWNKNEYSLYFTAYSNLPNIPPNYPKMDETNNYSTKD
jgi:hypothetical protein